MEEKKKKIYIAEDFPMLVELLKNALSKKTDYEPTFFTDGLELYLKVQKDPPDFLLLDIILPSLSGLAICRMLKFHDKYKEIPILVTSSITDQDIGKRAIEAGADDFLPKPFRTADLLHYIDEMINAS